MVRIPAEIFGQIAGLLARGDLVSLSRVSPASRGESNRLLYHDVDFSSFPVDFLSRDPASRRASDRPIDIFFTTIATSPAHAVLVESFALRLPYQPAEGVHPQSALQAMTNLRRLTVVSVLFLFKDVFPSFLHGCTTELRELDVGLPLNDNLFTFLSQRPKIHQVTIGKEKMPCEMETDSFRDLLSGRENLLPGLVKLQAIEGAVPLALLCPSLTELDIVVSERQDFSLVMNVMALAGKQLTRLRCQRSLYYGSDAIIQHLSSLAEVTPNLQALDILEHFCGGWGNPPCVQYLFDFDTLTLDGKWAELKTINWRAHLSCHDHLVYWKGASLCDRIFESLPSVISLEYTEERLTEVNSSVTFSYQRVGPMGMEWREVFQGASKPLQIT
ncbi:hypothetical protein BDM02DRAFT_3188846 [Thelephora ganbajun]|uniref:Uncharacterized protein n=1 Tax=Thelephora ganbajun TaxID=370292 RepID=A0ACB6ZAM6_THEGA|nr:hypothetical protein BDM02DRAFT_3188846 [Thelephora ganbajun]